MGYMKSVDSVLTAHKLSDAQKNAVVELLSGGATVAKAGTFKALERRGLVTKVDDFWQLTKEFRAELGTETHEEESVESLLQGDPWKMGNAITEDEAYVILDSDGELKDVKGTEFDKFDDMWDDIFKITAGFGATLDWRGTEVWNGLTAAEIREDIETAAPINRKARRTHFRTLRNAFRRLNNRKSAEARKALKITGKVGV